MARLHTLIDKNSRADFEQLTGYIEVCTTTQFMEEAVHPLLVGLDLIEGEMRPSSDPSPSSQSGSGTLTNETMTFNVPKPRTKHRSQYGGTEPDSEAAGKSAVSRCVYFLRQ